MNKLILKILPYVVIAILIFILLRGCHKPAWQEKPVVESVKSQQVKVDTVIRQDTKAIDSLAKIARINEEAASFWQTSSNELQKDYTTLAQKLQEVSKIDCPTLTPELERLAAIRAKELQAHGQLIGSLNKQISLKQGMVNQKEGTIKKLLSRIDTCLLNQTALQKYADKVKPRNQVYAGVMAMGNPVKPLSAYGIALGIKFKNGTQLQVMAMQFGNTTNYGIGIMKNISFRR